MHTNYHSPSTITQVPLTDESTSWNHDTQITAGHGGIVAENNDNLGYYSSTQANLYRIAMRDRMVRTNSANQVWCTNYRFSGIGVVTGIELLLVTQRKARIQDYVISLLYNNEIIGDNKFNDLAENEQIYGGDSDMWGTTLTAGQIESTSFGVVIGLGPNKNIPHRDSGFIDSVELKVYYE